MIILSYLRIHVNISSGLQYHDIIHQKITHIIEINQRLLAELLHYKNGELQVVFHISLLHGIAAYFMAQLGLIQKEFNGSFEEIKKQFIKLKMDVKEIDEVSWKDSKISASSRNQRFDLSEHLEQCWTFDTEIMQKIIEINSGIESKEIITRLMEILKGISGEADSFRSLNSEREQEEAIEALSQIFTMEAERELWKNIFHAAGFTAVLNHKEEKSDNIDLF